MHFWLMGFGIGFFVVNYFLDFPFGLTGMGIAFGALGLGIRQWFMADATADRIAGNYSNAYVGTDRKNMTYHGPDWE